MDLTTDDILKGINTMKNYAEELFWYGTVYLNNSDKLVTVLELENQDDLSAFLIKTGKEVEQLNSIIYEIKKISSIFSSLNLEETSIHYKTFILNEIINFNWSSLNYLNKRNKQLVDDFIRKLDGDYFEYNQADHAAISILKSMKGIFYNLIITFQDKVSSMKIFDNIKDIKDNIVIVGANGSGKSTFARNLKGKLSNNTTILSAQHLLVYNKPESYSSTNKEMELVHAFQSSDKLGSDINLLNLYSNDLNNLIGALFNENAEREHHFYQEDEEKTESVLIKAIKIWESIIEHRKLIHNRTSIWVETLEGEIYDFNFLSDGEKSTFYYIAHVLLSKRNSYIIVDEPESHLHLAICNKLWDMLELERKDCNFIYLTHNLDFATSRNNKVLIWNKRFTPPAEWEILRLNSDDHIPERLLIEILGSRKNIMFCEGDNKTSLDFKLYSILFREHTIIPVGGHLNVINYCKAYNRNKELYGLESIGIIDGDCHNSTQIQKWEAEGIFTLPINEIENLLCDEIILVAAINRFCCNENTLGKFKDNFFTELEKNKERQSVWYAKNIINNKFRSNMLKEEKKLETLVEEFDGIIKEDEILKNYHFRLGELNSLFENRDYDGALKITNFKGALINTLPKIIVNDYKDKIFMVIAEDVDLQREIKEKYFSMINEE